MTKSAERLILVTVTDGDETTECWIDGKALGAVLRTLDRATLDAAIRRIGLKGMQASA